MTTHLGNPCPHASVFARVTTKYGTLTVGTTSLADGRYRLVVPFSARVNDNLDWSVEAYTPEFERLELSGHRIIVARAPVSVDQPVDFPIR